LALRGALGFPVLFPSLDAECFSLPKGVFPNGAKKLKTAKCAFLGKDLVMTVPFLVMDVIQAHPTEDEHISVLYCFISYMNWEFTQSGELI